MLLGDRARWGGAEVHGGDDAVLLAIRREGRPTLVARGGHGVVHLLRTWCREQGERAAGAGWMTVPREIVVPDDVLGAVQLEPFSTWDWMMARTAPGPVDDRGGGVTVTALGPADAPAVQACLDVANPGTSARPGAAGDVGWWGVREPGEHGRLVAVVSATERSGDPVGHDRSWHLRGLGVHPDRRGEGLGRLVAAEATRAAFARGADWVSLGMYTQNTAARRVYESLGFTVGVEQRSYGPAGATSPPA